MICSVLSIINISLSVFFQFFSCKMEEIFRKKAEQDEEDEETVSLLTKYKGTPGSVCIPPKGKHNGGQH